MAMTSEDFWNLAGRAGRWGQEFQGNIFCIDINNEKIWPNGKPQKRIPYVIEPSVDKQLSNIHDLIDYIKDGTPRNSSGEFINFEYLISYVVEGITSKNTTILNSISNTESSDILIDEVKGMLTKCKLPTEIFRKNPGISPIAIESLYDYFESKVNAGEVESLIPPHPASEGAVVDFVKVLSRINKYLSPRAFGFTSGATFILSLLITKWMNGYTIARLIQDREQYLKKKKKSYKIASIIRGVLDDIENIARFRAPKYLACYNDVLTYVLNKLNKLDLIEHVDDVQLSLEFGVNIKTQLSLISLGLSRTSAIELSEFISDSELSPKSCIAWLQKNDLENLELPNLVIKEIKELLSES